MLQTLTDQKLAQLRAINFEHKLGQSDGQLDKWIRSIRKAHGQEIAHHPVVQSILELALVASLDVKQPIYAQLHKAVSQLNTGQEPTEALSKIVVLKSLEQKMLEGGGSQHKADPGYAERVKMEAIHIVFGI